MQSLNCQYCGKEESLPFVCNYCGGVFCADHRLPESHNCSGDTTRRPIMEETTHFSWDQTPSVEPHRTAAHSFSAHEVRDIVIAWLGLGIAFFFANTGGLINGFSGRIIIQNGTTPVVFGPLTVIALSLATVGVGFVLHELMHKFTSERYGYPAAFRMWPQGLLLALFLSAFAGFVFAAPGATYIEGYGITTKENGVISLAGPLTNIGLAILFFPFIFLNGGSPYVFYAGFLGSYINIFLAAFNMIPIMPLDGAKVWRWSKPLWAVVFIPLVSLLLGYFLGILPVI